jgi:hypothetical protein
MQRACRWNVSDIDSVQVRSDNISLFLQHFENYLREVAKTNHGATSEDLIRIVKSTFDRSMLASSHYHEMVADLHRKDGEIAFFDFHKIQSEVYKAMSSK